MNPSAGVSATIAPRGANLSDYVAYPDDEVDVAIGEYVKAQSDKPHLKAMFCRLSPGKYLYGTQKAEIELDHNKKLKKIQRWEKVKSIENFAFTKIVFFTRLQARHPQTGNMIPMDSFVAEMATNQ